GSSGMLKAAPKRKPYPNPPTSVVVCRVSTQASTANATIPAYHQPKGGKLRQSSIPPTMAADSCGSRATTASPNRLSHAGAFRLVAAAAAGMTSSSGGASSGGASSGAVSSGVASSGAASSGAA